VTEPDVTPEEELEAAALRAALDEGRAGAHLPDDALEAASLLRFGSNEGELSEARSARLRGELLAALPPRAARRARPRIMIWLAALGGVGAFAALLFTMKQPPAGTYAGQAAPAVPPVAALQPAEPSEGSRLALVNPSEDDDESAGQQGADDEMAERNFAQPPADSFAEPSAVVARNDVPAAELRGSGSARAKRSSESAGPATGALALGHAARAGAGAPAATLAPQAMASKPAAPVKAGGSTRERLERARARERRELDARLAARGAPGQAAKGRAQASGREALLAELDASKASNIDEFDRRPVQQDLYWRLADLALREGRPEQALDWARQGIALDGPPSSFLGLLWQAQGEAQEALGDREGAARSYLEAQSINLALLRQDLEQ
jgi:hypothetical protein